MTQFIFLEHMPIPADILLIPGCPYAALPEKAAELYRNGYIRRILPSGRYSAKTGHFRAEAIEKRQYGGEYPTEWAFMKAVLQKNGVPETAILKEDLSENTDENARFSAKLLRDTRIPMRRALLVCQAFHARRAYMTYRKYFPETELYVIPVNTQNITRNTWYQSETGYRRICGEIARIGTYFSEDFTVFTKEYHT